MRPFSLSLVLAFALGGAAFAAGCGPSAPPAETPPSPSATTPGTDAPPATTGAPSSTTTTPPAASTGATAPPAAGGGDMPNVKASTLADDLKAIGLDVNKLPKMGALSQQQRIKVMPILTKSTGLGCDECHTSDRKKDTHMKVISRHMWDEFTITGKLADGPLFCDSCHQGKHDFLTRSSRDAVSAYMDSAYVKKITRKDGNAEACTSCHGADFEMKIFEKLWKAKREAPAAAFVGADRAVIGSIP